MKTRFLVLPALVASVALATLLALWQPIPTVDAQAVNATVLRPPATKILIFRNKSGSTMYAKDPAETDSAWVRLTGAVAGGAKHALRFPTVGSHMTVDSLSINPKVEGGPFKMVFTYSGTISSDTIFITGLMAKNPKEYPFSYTTATIETLVCSGQNQLSRATYDSVSLFRIPTTGADSVVVNYLPLAGMADADSAESRFNFIGVVISDSVVDNALGEVAVEGPAFVRVNGNNTRINPHDFLTVGTTGFVKWTAAAGDTFGFGLAVPSATRANVDSIFAGSHQTIVGRALAPVTASGDSAWIYLDGSVW